MKKSVLTLILSFGALLSLSAMNYEEAREHARFLTDKMAYELNLNDQQYNDCFEINLDYFLSVASPADVYGAYLDYRNADLRFVLLDWQYALFTAADYFLRPLHWLHGAWTFSVYRYYHAGYYYYDHPRVFWSYRGGHGRVYYHAGFYADRRPHHWAGGFRGHDRGAVSHRGGHFGGGASHRGDYRRGGSGYHFEGGGHRSDNGVNHRSGNGGYHFEHGGTRPDNSGHRSDNGGYRSDNNGHRSDNGGYRFGNGDHRSGNGYSSSSYQHPSSTRTTVRSGQESSGYRLGHTSSGSSRSGGFGGVTRSSGATRSGSAFQSSHSGSRGSGFSRSSGGGGVTRGGGFSHGGAGSARGNGGSSRGGRGR